MRKLLQLSLKILGIILLLALIQNPVWAKEKKDISIREKELAAQKPPATTTAKIKSVPKPPPAGKIKSDAKNLPADNKKKDAKNKNTKKKTDTKSNAVLKTAAQYLGTPYEFGGTSSKGFDCSGYVMYVFREHGKKLPRMSDEQFKAGKKVDKSKVKEGDLVFFTTYESGASHVGIYYGGNEFIHVSSSKGVMISKLDDVYWQPRYLGARRVL